MESIHEHFLNKDEGEASSSSDSEEEEVKSDQGEDQRETKVKFAEEEVVVASGKESESENESEEKEEKKEPKARKVTASKLEINEDYVKQRVKKQFWNNEKKGTARRNKNKDKKTMKAQETIKDYFVE